MAKLSSILLLVCIALAAASPLSDIGVSAGHAVVGTVDSQVVSRSATPGLTGRAQAAIASVLETLGSAGRRLYVEAVKAAEKGDVFSALNRRQRLIAGAPDEALASGELINYLDAVVGGAYRSSSRQVRSLDRGILAQVREAVMSDRSSLRRIQAIFGDKDRLLDNIRPERALSADEEAVVESAIDASRAWNSMMIEKDTRAAMLQGIDDDALAYTDAFWSEATSLPPEQRTWDVLHVGAGLASSHAASLLADRSSATRLVVEASDSASSANFRAVGEAFAYNMTNRFFRYFGPQGPGKRSNLAPIASPTNPSHLSGLKYGEGKTWAEAAAVALRSSEADVVVSTRVIDVVEDTSPNAPGFWKVTLQRGDETTEVWANTVFDSPGAGRPKLIGDEQTKGFSRREIAKLNFEDPTRVPLVMTARDELTMSALHPEWRDATLVDPQSPELRDLVVGIGDSAFTVIEDRLGLAFQKHSRAVAQRGIFAGMDFAVGEDGPRAAREFLLGRSEGRWKGVRTRYVDIYTAIFKAQEKILEESRLSGRDITAIETGGNLSDSALDALRADIDPEPETLRLRAARLETLRPETLESGREVVRATFSDGTSQVYRRAILSTGYEVEAKRFRSLFPNAPTDSEVLDRSLFDVIDAEGRVIEPSQVAQDGSAVARQVPDKPYYLTGFGAGTDLIPVSELADVTENNAAFFNWGPRIESLIDYLTADGSVRANGLSPFRPRVPERSMVRILEDDISRGTLLAREVRPLNARQRLSTSGNPQLALRVELYKMLTQIEASGDTREMATLTFTRGADGSISWTSNLASADFSAGIKANSRLTGLLDYFVMRDAPLEVRFRFRSGTDEERAGLPRTVLPNTLRIGY